MVLIKVLDGKEKKGDIEKKIKEAPSGGRRGSYEVGGASEAQITNRISQEDQEIWRGHLPVKPLIADPKISWGLIEVFKDSNS